jgi:hypothetical protein
VKQRLILGQAETSYSIPVIVTSTRFHQATPYAPPAVRK